MRDFPPAQVRPRPASGSAADKLPLMAEVWSSSPADASAKVNSTGFDPKFAR